MTKTKEGSYLLPSISDYHNIHQGETCVLVGNGLNLNLTPPCWFDLPSFGMNTIHKRWGWRPYYYCAVDSRVMREFGDEVMARFGDIPKFIPTPNLDAWQGPNFYRFYHRPGPLWPYADVPFPADILSETGITYSNVMHIAMQLAYFMGFTTMLIIGMEHGKDPKQHFWGSDEGMPGVPPVEMWLEGYKTLREKMGVRMLNLSVNTHVPEEIIPRDDWWKWTLV
jgi:hypothetical protein